ncbi:MAG: hypothetical protein ACREB8_12770 [Pseudolabrys sp.]
MTTIEVREETFTPKSAAGHYALALFAAYVEADARLQRHRSDCMKMLKADLRFALIENSLKLKLCLAEARLVDEVEAHGGKMTIDDRIVTVGWAMLGTDRRRRKWISVK